MSWILSRLVDPEYLKDRPFEYREANLKERGSEVLRRNPSTEKDRVYNYFKDPYDAKWRFAEEPHHVRGYLRIFAIATVVLFTATCMLRLVQTALILPGVFYRTFRESFPQREDENFSEILVTTFEAKVKDQGEAFYTIGSLFVLDMKCSLSMETAALVGGFSWEMDKVIQMQIIFSNMEKKWNHEKSPEGSLVALWARTLKYRNLFEISIADWREIQKASNKSFYIYQCAQPVDEAFLARINFLEDVFPNYQAIVAKYERRAQALKDQMV